MLINAGYREMTCKWSKMRFLSCFITSLMLLVLFACQPGKKNVTKIMRAEELIASGEFSKLKAYADSILITGNLTRIEAVRLDSLREMSERIKLDFSLNEADIRSRLMKYYPKLDSKQLVDWENKLKLEMRRIDGEKRYFKNAVGNLFMLDDVANSRKIEVEGYRTDSLKLFCVQHTRKIISETMNFGEPVHPVGMKLTYSIVVRPNAVPEGEIIRCWMPFPREGSRRQINIRLLKSDPDKAVIAPESDLQRSVYLEKQAKKDKPTLFQIELEVETSAQYFDLNPEMINPYDTGSAVYKEFTSERRPQIVFTREIKQLAKRIIGREVNPLRKVQKIYNWINDSIRWASALEYGTMPDIPGYVLKNRHGDCGMQTLLFMALSRSQGIPVKWQSGWMLHPRAVNLHDWCEVYYEGVGWVPLDQSFGLQDDANVKVRNFYRSGIDSYRLIVNDDYACDLSPRKKYRRSEPSDFQRGELEWEGGNLYFNTWSWNMEVEYR